MPRDVVLDGVKSSLTALRTSLQTTAGEGFLPAMQEMTNDECLRNIDPCAVPAMPKAGLGTLSDNTQAARGNGYAAVCRLTAVGSSPTGQLSHNATSSSESWLSQANPESSRETPLAEIRV